MNIRAHASAMRVTCVCARSTRERVSIASIPRPLLPRKKVEGLGTRLACPLCVNLVYAFERERVHFRVLACTRASTHVCVFEYSRATREGCQVARERHCNSTSMGLAHMATEMPIEQMEVLQTALKKLIGSASMNELTF